MTRVYEVPTISCDHCKHTIEGAVSKVSGVELVTVDVTSKTVQVDGEASDTTVRAAIEDAGYGVAGVRPA